ncbi:hypothetical protein [Nocardia sp. NPDC051750]|uniref:hypothetical protein n=1 Tax=Nocardia sp. NPDC051750 TaxID=3364325 RepID=UPI0037AC2303
MLRHLDADSALAANPAEQEAAAPAPLLEVTGLAVVYSGRTVAGPVPAPAAR